MQSTTRSRLGLWAIIVLVILNLSWLTFFWFNQFIPKEPPREKSAAGTDDFISQELRLDVIQADSVKSLRRVHFLRTDSIKAQMVDINRQMLGQLFAPVPDTAAVRVLSEQIGQKQAEFDRQVYRHFENIKSLLRPDQYQQFKELIFDALKMKDPANGHTVDDQRPLKEDRGQFDERRPPPPGDRRPPRADDRRPPPRDDRRSPTPPDDSH